MRFLGTIIILGLAAVVVFTFGATAMKMGASSFDDPQGISLRQESRGAGGMGFFYIHRTHRGGGLAGGK